jgi:isopentenyl diphosphate isomerase/L-lactate dehydrogenase-like FMN-dependent dehydrogenase
MANMKFFKGTETTVLGGHKVATPIALGNLPMQKRFHFDGEIASAQAAKEMGIIYTVEATQSSYTLSKILSESAGGLKLLKLSPGMMITERVTTLKSAQSNPDIIGVVMDFGLEAKIDSN